MQIVASVKWFQGENSWRTWFGESPLSHTRFKSHFRKQRCVNSVMWIIHQGLPWWSRSAHLSVQGIQVWSLLREDPTCLWATKPGLHNYWAHRPKLLKPACPSTRALQQEQPCSGKTTCTTEEQPPPQTQQERPMCSSEDPGQSKLINQLIKKYSVLSHQQMNG